MPQIGYTCFGISAVKFVSNLNAEWIASGYTAVESHERPQGETATVGCKHVSQDYWQPPGCAG